MSLTAQEIHYAFRGLAMSLLTRKERSLWGLIVFAFPLESSCISFANIVFRNSAVALFHYFDGCLERRTVDSCGNSTCLKTPQSGFLEEAEAVPAESNAAHTYHFISTAKINSNNSLRCASNCKCLRWGDDLYAAPVPQLIKTVFIKKGGSYPC